MQTPKTAKTNSYRPLFLSGLFSAAQITTVLLGSVLIPNLPAHATRHQDYQACAIALRQANLPAEQAAQACAQTLYPREVSNCIVQISQRALIAAGDALPACLRVRRPQELATCVVDIQNRTQDASSLSVLDNCRRSLLPVQFSQCVVALSSELNLAPARAMQTCISARD